MWYPRPRSFLISILILLLLQPWFLTADTRAAVSSLSAEAAQVAEILGVKKEAEQIHAYYNRGEHTPNLSRLRALVLRKILLATLQVKSAENKLLTEIAYTNHVMARDQRHQNFVNEVFTIANFLQFGILYSIEGRSRIHNQFTQSAVCTSVGAGLGLGLPILSIMYNKVHKAGNLKPPAFLGAVLTGSAVDITELPPLVKRYMDFPEPGGATSRYEDMNVLWKKRYGADLSKKETLCAIDDGKSKNPFLLTKRIQLLWSLTTIVERFDRHILALLNEIKNPEFGASKTGQTTLGLPAKAQEAARLLKIEPLVAELQSMNGHSDRKTDLQLTFLENVLSGSLELRNAADGAQLDLNYQYDVVLSGLMARRGNLLTKLFELNFSQTNILGACAGWSYLNHYPKAGNELFIVADSIGLGITTLSLLVTHGGFKKIDTEPNTLANFFGLRADGFSPIVSEYLNSADPDITGSKPRKQYLLDLWKADRAVNVDLEKVRMQERLACMPSAKWNSIKLVVNRITLLSSLEQKFQEFDSQLLSLMRACWPAREEKVVTGTVLSSHAQTGANILGVNSILPLALHGDESAKMQITRDIMEGYLDVNSASSRISRDIVLETQVKSRMERQRDSLIQLTNIVNFYQIGVLGITIDSLGLSTNDQYVLDGNRINIVSGIMVASLAATALLERAGGPRPGRAEVNMLAEFLGRPAPESIKLSPLILRFLDSVPPSEDVAPEYGNNLTRRQCLVKFWNQSVQKNPTKQSVAEKLSASGKAHHWWTERLDLLAKRISMLYDLRAALNITQQNFAALLSALD